MKRSEINTLMFDADEFFKANKFYLPPFAYWKPDDWSLKCLEVEDIVKNRLGWDITDYGIRDFKHYGLLLFTLRNGNVLDWSKGVGKPYAEKVMIAEVGQVHQMHYHWQKMEDIINRAGGELVIQLYNSGQDDELANTAVSVSVDGVWRTIPAGDVIVLRPGESITLTPGCYHKFWAEKSRVLIGEVSMINDDQTDNQFHEMIGTGRFSEIEEDEDPLYLLSTDYERYWEAANCA